MTDMIAPVEPAATGEVRFEFDEDFQTKIAALALRDSTFLKNTDGLLRPDFFENVVEASLVNLSLQYYQTYKKAPDATTFKSLLKDAIATRKVRSDMVKDAAEAAIRLYKEVDISDRDYVVDKVEEFARHQAVGQAILGSVDLLGRGDFAKIETSIKAALDVGANRGQTGYDYFAEIKNRTQERRDIIAGKIKPNGITTGVKAIDDRLLHKGWGRKELSTILGGAKAGKSTALLNFGKAACFNGHNVIYFTLELSEKIASERLDAAISGQFMNELAVHLNEVETKVMELTDKVGAYKIHRYPTGTMKPSDIRRTLEVYRTQGITFDLIIVDYAQIMAPERWTPDPIENSKSIHSNLRAIADEEDAAVLTATQTNREGFKSAVAKAEHTSEDFNIVRIVDLQISINKTEDEASRNEARLYFAASRNQAGGFTIKVQQDLERARFITRVLGIE